MKLPTHLFHYFEKNSEPLQSMTAQGFDKATEIQKNITKGFNSQRPPNYVELRFAVEKRLKSAFESKGGKPKSPNPSYFTLGSCDWVKSCYDDPSVTIIPLADVDPEQLTFTYPDSMVSFQFHDEPKLGIYRKPCNGQVFLLDEIMEVIDQYGLPSEEKWQNEEASKYDRYIEVQVWDDDLVKLITKGY